MSYIGKNPKVDSVKLTGTSTAASGTEEGQIYYNTGAGSISKGLKVYKNGQFVSIDKQLGDADTMQLLKAADIPAIDFNLSVTSTTVGGNNAVPFESSTGAFDGTASFSNDSTGNALLTDESADLVFHYETQATNSADNDFFGIPLTVPKAFRGGNLVLEFKYRTLIATGTMDDGYFNIALQDRSSMILQTQDSTITAGAISAGSNVLLTGKTYSNPVTGTTLTVAVGDRVFVESGTGTAGSQDNDIVDAYITEVSSTDNNVKLSKDIVAVQSGKFVTGWLTGYDTEGQLAVAASDTDKVGSTKKIQFKTDDDTQQVSLWFFVKGTSTVKHDLFFDNILLSANKFLQASSQTKSEVYVVQGGQVAANGDSTNTTAGYYFGSTNTPNMNTIDKLGTVINDNATGFKFTANQDLMISAHFSGAKSTDGWLNICSGPDSALTNNDAGHADFDAYRRGGVVVSANSPKEVAANFRLPKGEVFRFYSTNTAAAYTGTIVTMGFTATPMVSDVVLLESQDEIFTDWVEYTPTFTGFGTCTNIQASFRRVGQNMEIVGSFTSGTVTTDLASITIPSGYAISLGVPAIQYGPNNGTFTSNEAIFNSRFLYFEATETDKFYITQSSNTTAPTTRLRGDQTAPSTNICDFQGTFPISGWNSNFNPLLSMPLVDIGNDIEQYSLNGWTGNAGTRSLYSTNTPNINTIDKLGTISTMSSTVAWSFTASQRVKVNIGAQYGQTTGGNWFSIASGPASTAGDQDKAFDHADILPLNKTVSRTSDANHAETTSASFLMEPGEVCMIHLNASGSVNSTGYQGGVWMTAERVKGPNNMAHIIKPAVAVLNDLIAAGTGGQAITTSFADINMTGAEGETWFFNDIFQNGTSGAGGTNSRFELTPGTYELEGRIPMRNQATRYGTARFYNHTSSSIIGQRTSMLVSDSGSAYEGVTMSVYATVTLTANSVIALQMGASVAGGDLGNDYNIDSTVFTGSQIKIRKLK